MGDSYDDAEVAGAVDSTYCQKHKAGKGLWPHECPDCIKESKAKRARNRDNWKKRAEAAEAKLDWLMVQGIRGIAPGWVGIPEVEWDSTYPPNPTGQGRSDCGAYPGPGCSVSESKGNA